MCNMKKNYKSRKQDFVVQFVLRFNSDMTRICGSYLEANIAFNNLSVEKHVEAIHPF